jgi:hypothetical protein
LNAPLVQSCWAHQFVCALHWNEQIVPVLTAFFSNAQAPGGSFILAAGFADASGTLEATASATARLNIPILRTRMINPRFQRIHLSGPERRRKHPPRGRSFERTTLMSKNRMLKLKAARLSLFAP